MSPYVSDEFLAAVAGVYAHVTGGHITDPEANPLMVIKFADDRIQAVCKKAIAEAVCEPGEVW